MLTKAVKGLVRRRLELLPDGIEGFPLYLDGREMPAARQLTQQDAAPTVLERYPAGGQQNLRDDVCRLHEDHAVRLDHAERHVALGMPYGHQARLQLRGLGRKRSHANDL